MAREVYINQLKGTAAPVLFNYQDGSLFKCGGSVPAIEEMLSGDSEYARTLRARGNVVITVRGTKKSLPTLVAALKRVPFKKAPTVKLEEI